jgi:hypothetical protein
MKKEKNKFIKSTLIVLITSAIGGFAISLLGGSFIAGFLIFAISQYILFSFIGYIIQLYFFNKTKELELQKLENLSTILECATCKSPHVMTFIPDENQRIEFVCEKCEKRNLVTMNFLVAHINEPVKMPTINGIPLRGMEANDL